MEKAYDAKSIESKWYTFWEENAFFEADATSQKPPYTIVIPPPNVTGVLHMGHALVNTLQDILIRWKRMSGYEALWVPGTDHAGIATQTVVERHLIATEGKRRKDYTRKTFVDTVWKWKEKSETTILMQLKRLGCSCDWSRLRFTMDAGCNRAVRTLFKKLFDAGLIYRGDYLVNWDPITQTALADDEVEHEERQSYLWYFKYHLVDSSEFIRIATTRPETLLGDTAIAVSPSDPRYQHLIGKKVRLPILDREIPIIADHHVDPEFGTGAVKITPAHDPNDYRMGLDHNLEMINILTPDGFINENGGPFQGLSREEARQAVIHQMEGLGLLEKKEPHTLRVGVSYRSKAVIEPYLSKQWFVKMDSFISPLKKAVESGEVKILPKTWESTYFHWVNNLRDWCISRQLWWGHRIPVWYRKDDPENVICHEGEGVPEEVKREPEMWEQDPDVLDTWFSSSLWPFSTLGWPDKSADLKKFYPTNVLITGHDILFFWVARMIFMGKEALQTAPFPETFLHGLIYGKSYWRRDQEGGIAYVSGKEKRDYDLGKPVPKEVESKWEKLSKSKGNVIDPLEMIEEYGTDAVRMSLCACANQTPQIDLDRRRFEEFKNFANKVWNGARFVFMNLEGLTSEMLVEGLDDSLFTLEDRWILSALNRINGDINQHLEAYHFDQAALSAYDFFWKEFCAYYVEIAKPVLFGKKGSAQERANKQKILLIVLVNSIRLLHPMAPFITEELFQNVKQRFPKLKQTESDPYTQATIEALLTPACVVAPYPTPICPSDRLLEVEQQFATLEKMLYTIRNIRGEMKIPPQMATDVLIIGKGLEKHFSIIEALVKTNKVEVIEQIPQEGLHATGVVDTYTIVIPLPEELAQKEVKRLEKELEKTEQTVARLKKLLSNPDFLEKAAPELIEKQKAALLQAEQTAYSIKEKINK
ncbi:MAG: Valine--tRNA ligase [Chlamydiales bacterium]|nr:Valine--tRNA ligase [Chlamydiales bacterium]